MKYRFIYYLFALNYGSYNNKIIHTNTDYYIPNPQRAKLVSDTSGLVTYWLQTGDSRYSYHTHVLLTGFVCFAVIVISL